MSHQLERTTIESLMAIVEKEGWEGLSRVVTLLFNEAMRLERERWLGAARYERTPQRRDYANGYKPKRVKTRVGELELAVPQVRGGGFYPSVLERGLRSERALYIAIAESYIKGGSTRKTAQLFRKAFGLELTATQVSRATALLDEELRAWRERPLGRYRYLYLDARYEHVRQGGMVIDAAVLWAVGVDEQGYREVLGVSVALSEAEVHWRDFLESLLTRGLHGVELIVADDHAGLQAARRAVFPSVPWQRCQCHLQRNVRAYLPRKGMAGEVRDALRAIFNAPDRQEAERLLEQMAQRYEQSAPKLAAWLRENVPQGMTVFDFPRAHRTRLRTTNLMERCSQQIKHRTQQAVIFPNEAACLRLVTAVLIEISETWQTGRRYLNMEAT